MVILLRARCLVSLAAGWLVGLKLFYTVDFKYVSTAGTRLYFSLARVHARWLFSGLSKIFNVDPALLSCGFCNFQTLQTLSRLNLTSVIVSV